LAKDIVFDYSPWISPQTGTFAYPQLPQLTYNNVWVGDIANIAQESTLLNQVIDSLNTISGKVNQIEIQYVQPTFDTVHQNITVSLALDPVLPGVGAVTIPLGLPTDRPNVPTPGMLRFLITT